MEAAVRLLLVPPLVSFAVDPGALWAEYTGIFFHLSLLLLVDLLNAPTWARAAGYSWLAIDVLGARAPAGILTTIWLILLAVIGVPQCANLTS